MQEAYEAAYTWTAGFIDMTWMAWPVASGVMLMALVIRYLRIANNLARGGDSFDTMTDEAQYLRDRYTGRRSSRWRR